MGSAESMRFLALLVHKGMITPDHARKALASGRDPREEKNLIGEDNRRAQRMAAALRQYLKQPRLECCALR